MYKIKTQLRLFAHGSLFFLPPVIEETVLFPLSGLDIFVEPKLAICMEVNFCVFHFSPLACLAVLMSLPHCFDYLFCFIFYTLRSFEGHFLIYAILGVE